MEKPVDILKSHWGFNSFREPQEKVIQTVLSKKDTFVLLPTGAGKSLCYQLPALMSDGVCLVISPLIALMEDQVKSLGKKGIKAMALSSKMNQTDTIIAFDNLMYGNYKFLYLSPEKLQSAFIQEKISQLRVHLIAIDEAHCISQWGHDFRSAYLKIPVLNDLLPGVPKIALTATATSLVKSDILENLKMSAATIFTGSYYRPNLHIRIQKREDLRTGLLQILRASNESAIVYVGTRKNTIQYARFLNAEKMSATYYHGGLTTEQKTEALDQWMGDQIKVMVATNAFGMGIDKANVRTVIHTHLPGSIENYMQEIGRAGRDSKPSFTYLLFNDNSIFESKMMLKKSMISPEDCRTVYIKLCDNFQIAKGELNEEIYNFDLQNFSLNYDFSTMQVFYALNHLHNEGVLLYDQNPNKMSSVRVVEKSQKLFEVQSLENVQARVLQMLLRTYGGILDQFIGINEYLLSRKLNIAKEDVINALKKLDLDKIISYHPLNNAMKLKFLVPREDNFIYHMIRGNIVHRNKVKKDKVRAIHQFVHNDQVCRQIQLLDYFGQKLEKDCGHCDVCLDRINTETIDAQELSDNLLTLLEERKELNLNEIKEILPLDPDAIVKTLQILVERNFVGLNLQNKFYLIT